MTRKGLLNIYKVVFVSLLLVATGGYAADKPEKKGTKHVQTEGKFMAPAAVNDEPLFTPHAIVTLTNNFMWRGRSLSSNRTTIMGIFLLKTKYGLYGEMFASNVRFFAKDQVTKILLIPSIGFAHKFGQFGFDIGASKYLYPNTTRIDWYEEYLRLSYRFLIAAAYYGGHFLQTDRQLTYYFGVNYPLPFTGIAKDLTFKGVVGRNEFFSGSLHDAGADYTYFELGLTKKLNKNFSAGILYSHANGKVIDFSNGDEVVVNLTAMI